MTTTTTESTSDRQINRAAACQVIAGVLQDGEPPTCVSGGGHLALIPLFYFDQLAQYAQRCSDEIGSCEHCNIMRHCLQYWDVSICSHNVTAVKLREIFDQHMRNLEDFYHMRKKISGRSVRLHRGKASI